MVMEVTAHLKSVLKNYQHSATKSLQGPGGLQVAAGATSSPCEEEFVPAPLPPQQQLPILTAPDTSYSERSETNLEGEYISCFLVSGERRLCLPQVLNLNVLRNFTLNQINAECDRLQIYCSRCSEEQLNVLKSHGILPSSASSCGLITKTNAERLCSALLYNQPSIAPGAAPRYKEPAFHVYHKCFSVKKVRGLCYPDLYTSKRAKCLVCLECQGGFTPQQFVCHVHTAMENRTVHWGFDSTTWRRYLHIHKTQPKPDTCLQLLDKMQEQFEGKQPFVVVAPEPANSVEAVVAKRKQMLCSELALTNRDLPLKKQKLEYHLPFNLYLDPYLQYLQDFNAAKCHISAFKPVAQSIKESKIRQATALGVPSGAATNHRYSTQEPPTLQNPERVISVSDSERFERTYQPNVALAPPTPKKHRYGRAQAICTSNDCVSTTVKEIKVEMPSPPPTLNGREDSTSPNKVDSTVETKYNPEIELSTDTEDSASESSERQGLEEMLKGVDELVKGRVLEFVRNLSSQYEQTLREKDELIGRLQAAKTPPSVIASLQDIESKAISAVEQDTSSTGCPEISSGHD